MKGSISRPNFHECGRYTHLGLCSTNDQHKHSSFPHKLNFAGHVIITTELRRMHLPPRGIFLRWNSNLQQVDFSQGFAWNNILGLGILGVGVNDGFLHFYV